MRSGAYGEPRYDGDTCRILQGRFPGIVEYFAPLEVEGIYGPGWTAHAIAVLRNAVHDGAAGVKIWNDFGMSRKNDRDEFVLVTDRTLDPIFAWIESHHLPVVNHAGDPEDCSLFQKGSVPSYSSLIAARDSMLARHPRIKFIGAHIGSMENDLDEVARRLDAYPNFAVDIGGRVRNLQAISLCDREKVRSFMITYQDRILYGTDFVDALAEDGPCSADYFHSLWKSDWLFLATDSCIHCAIPGAGIRGLALPRQTIDRIYRLNAERWQGIKPPFLYEWKWWLHAAGKRVKAFVSRIAGCRRSGSN
jgi:predicted TIM-barrel fold metal-dependent hydrolase